LKKCNFYSISSRRFQTLSVGSPDGKIFAGVPYKIIRDTLDRYKKCCLYRKQLYINLAREYPTKFERIG